MNTKQTIAVVALIVGTLAAGWVVLSAPDSPAADEHGREASELRSNEPEHAEGSVAPRHGGRVFTTGAFTVELAIAEDGIQPEFRAYLYKEAKPLAPTGVELVVELRRLGRDPQRITFDAVGDYLRGNAEIVEPHSFEVTINVAHDGKRYTYTYAQAEGRVSISTDLLERSGIRLAKAGPASIAITSELLGEVTLNEDRLAHVVPPIAGIARSVVARTGDRVAAGQLLAVLSSQTLAQQRSALLSARKRRDLARTVVAREQQLWDAQISAEQDLIQARNGVQEADIEVAGLEQQLSALGISSADTGDLASFELRAPFSGTIIERHISQGEAVGGDASAFVIADLSTVWIAATVSSRDLASVRAGLIASVRSGAKDEPVTGTVEYVSPIISEDNRTAAARIVLDNADGRWRPGLPVQITIVSERLDVPLAVEREALQTFRDWTVVFGRYGDAFEARPVALGRGDATTVEILEGLLPGESYAATNGFLIKADIEKSGASHDH